MKVRKRIQDKKTSVPYRGELKGMKKITKGTFRFILFIGKS